MACLLAAGGICGRDGHEFKSAIPGVTRQRVLRCFPTVSPALNLSLPI
jgi:hypothetical protein